MRRLSTIILVVLLAAMLGACAQQAQAPEPTAAPAAEPTMAEAEPTAAPEPAEAPTEEAAAAMPEGLPAYTGGPAELRMGWWGNDDRAERTLKVIDLFQAAYPDIKVSGEPNGGTPDHFQIIDTQLAANDAPDIIQFGSNWPDYQQYLEPLNDYLGNQLMIADLPGARDRGADVLLLGRDVVGEGR